MTGHWLQIDIASRARLVLSSNHKSGSLCEQRASSRMNREIISKPFVSRLDFTAGVDITAVNSAMGILIYKATRKVNNP